MQELKPISFQIVGVYALLMNNPASMQGGNDKGAKAKKIPTPEEEAKTKVYRLDDGQLYFPSEGFRRGIIKRACAGRKIGKFYATSVVPGALFLLNDRSPLVDPETGVLITEYAIDTRRAVIQKAGIMRSRPRIEHWSTTVNYEIDPDFLDEATVLDLQNIAGKIAGIGDYRPEKTGPFGRYYAELIIN